MRKVQEKLKGCIESQTLKSLDRLSDALDTTNDADDDANTNQMETDIKTLPAIDASETAGKGENKVLVSKRSKRKQKHSYRMKAIERKGRVESEKPKPKPRYHCAF